MRMRISSSYFTYTANINLPAASMTISLSKMADAKFIDRSYGKAFVKMLHIKRNGNVHAIKEYEVSTLITLNSDKDYKQVSR